MQVLRLLTGTAGIHEILENIESDSERRRLLAATCLQEYASKNSVPSITVVKISKILQRPNNDIRTVDALIRSLFHIDNNDAIIVAEWYLCKLAKDAMYVKTFPERGVARGILEDVAEYISPNLISYNAVSFALLRVILDPSTPEHLAFPWYKILKRMNNHEVVSVIPKEQLDRFIKAYNMQENAQEVVSKYAPKVAAEVVNSAFSQLIKYATQDKVEFDINLVSDTFFKDLNPLLVPYCRRTILSPYNNKKVTIPEIADIPKDKAFLIFEEFVESMNKLCILPARLK